MNALVIAEAKNPWPLTFSVSCSYWICSCSSCVPLNGVTGGRDISINHNKAATLVNVKPAPGPDGLPLGSFLCGNCKQLHLLSEQRLYGHQEFNDNCSLGIPRECRSNISLFPKGRGVHLWMKDINTILVEVCS